MCGIVSYIGKKPAKAILIEGLKSLEYRGYDSSGIALLTNDLSIEFEKSKGKISDLENKISSRMAKDSSREFSAFDSSTCGIGHTRWATHGEANETNAHPHQDLDLEVSLVHNGIISNYLEIKQELELEGIVFRTETDTEVIAQLFAKNKKTSSSELEALRKTIARLEGSYALSILNKKARKILVAKNESPLVIGIGEEENYVASDSATVLQFTDKVLRLKDLQVAEVTDETVYIEDIDGNPINGEIHQLVKISSVLEKGPYKHFLLKEIHEQPGIISSMLNNFTNNSKSPDQLIDGAFELKNINVKELNRIVFVACGTAYHAALLAKNLIELWAKIPVEVALASEFLSSPALVTEKDLVVAISQSGETADTLAAMRSAKDAGAQLLAVTNRSDSALADMSKPNVYVTPAGIEVSVASTKAFTSQLMALYFFALQLAKAKDTLEESKINIIIKELHTLPQLLDQVIERADTYKEIFIKFSEYRDFLFLGRGVHYPIALEGALKLKELSYIHATGYASGEMKHGPIAILDQNVPVLNIAINGETELEKKIYDKTMLSAQEAKARKSPSLVLTCDSNKDADLVFDEVIRIPNVSQILSPIIATIPLQFLAYFVAEDLGKDIDQPRNLAKSVTVE